MNIALIFRSILGRNGDFAGKDTTPYLPIDDFSKSGLKNRKYLGKRVVGDIIIRYAHTGYKKDVIHILAKHDLLAHNIWLTLDFNKFPEVLRFDSGDRMKVLGKISRIQGQDIYIEPDELLPSDKHPE